MHYFKVLILILAAALSARAAQPPRLFYSDLESGPNTGGQRNGGAFVTLYGARFGTIQGSSFVTVGSGKAISYVSWTDEKVVIQLGPAATTGQIVVHTAAGASNDLPFTVRPGKIYFVAKTGNDGANGSFSSPWRTLIKGRDSIQAGDIVYAMDGVSQTEDDGQGWDTCMLLRNGGGSGNPMAIVAYPNAKVVIGSVSGPGRGIRTLESGPGQWVFAGFILRGGSLAMQIWGSNHWRIVANDMSCPNGNGASACFITSKSAHIKFFGNNVHDVGSPNASALYHGVYFSSDANHVEAAWNTVANVHGCRGMQFHSSPLGSGGPNDPTGHNQFDLSVHDNVIHDTQCDGLIFATVDPSQGKVEVYNNVIYNAGKGPNNPENSGNWACIYVAGYTNNGPEGGGVVDVFNNTMYNCGTFAKPPYSDSRAAVMHGGHSTKLHIQIRNNIMLQSGGIPYLLGDPGMIQGTNNLMFGTGATPTSFPHVKNSLNQDPRFANPLKADFHLMESSPARGAGVQTGLYPDKDGIARDTSYDLGAFQFVPTSAAAASTEKPQR